MMERTVEGILESIRKWTQIRDKDVVTNMKYRGTYSGLQSEIDKSSRKNGSYPYSEKDLWLSTKWTPVSEASKEKMW